MSTYLVQLADWLRAAGLNVVEVDGWQTRARGSGGYATGKPWVIMWHHTASQTTPENDVAYICEGSDNAPLANLYLARDGTVYVCAAGATNTNGSGGPLDVSRGTVPVDAMNTYAVGIEAANSGTGEQWPSAQIDAYFVVSNCLAEKLDLLPTDIASHAAWSPTRKIDPATAAAVVNVWQPRSINSSGTWSLDDMRAEASARADGTLPPPSNGDDDDMKRVGPFLIQATGADGTPAGRVYATDGNFQTLRWLSSREALEGYRWTLKANGFAAPELEPDAAIMPVDTLEAYGVVLS